MPTTARRLPGIRFETLAPPLPDVLPRMDIGAFVGFAASGPLDVPVAVEDAAQFADVFGADARLAWNAERGEELFAYLGPAVRAFFRNGGSRCWVVRVADRHAAAVDRFAISGVAQVDSFGELAPAVLDARAVGSWADGMRVSSRIVSTPILLEERAPLVYEAIVSSRDAIATGDAIRITYPGTPWTLLWTVASVAPSSTEAFLDGLRVIRLDVLAGHPYWTQVADLVPTSSGHVEFIGPHGENRVLAATVEAMADDGLASLTLIAPSGRPAAISEAPPAGSLVRAVFGSPQVWLVVADVVASDDGGATLVGTPIQVETTAPQMKLAQEPGALAERLTVTLHTEDETRGVSELGGFGFAPSHPRFLGKLPADDDLYGPDGAGPEEAELWAAAAEPRFPLAAPPAPLPERYVPLGASILPSASLPAIRPHGSTRLRDGLEHFDPSLFVDAALQTSSSTVLMDDADFVRYRSPASRALHGMHALLAIEEATIVAVPDAVHAGWFPADADAPAPASGPPSAPTLDWATFIACTSHIPSAPDLSRRSDDPEGVITLAWSASDAKHPTYELQEDVDGSFATAETIWSGPDREYAVYARPDGSTLYFRVRAVAAGTEGGWSNAVVVLTAGESDWLVSDTASYTAGGLVSVHAALLRMCAARGDLFGVLALPEHFRERAAAAYADALRAGADVTSVTGRMSPESDDVFSRGALYHPWLYAVDPSDPAAIRRVPPDGSCAGEIAARAASPGPWAAPANRPLRDVVALDPSIGQDAYRLLQGAQVNLVRQDPGGFLTLAADTLSRDHSLRPIGTRRLLDTLRRLAVLHGARYAFEPNGDVLRRAARRSFQALLTRMFELGAFAGATPAESFRVATGSPPNTAESLDAGRLIVELQVAPSRPLVFLTVRLTRTGSGALQVETR